MFPTERCDQIDIEGGAGDAERGTRHGSTDPVLDTECVERVGDRFECGADLIGHGCVAR